MTSSPNTNSVDPITLAASIARTVIEMQSTHHTDIEIINAIISMISPDYPFRAASTADLAKALGSSPDEAGSIERGVNAVIRRIDMVENNK